ncbi:hypothetical protein F2Q68_00005151 [Brassica cretica]|uniref:Uncharacterized protein n=1 Tax=Brassica cretica TaxID=69181 RepID=A0A8S9JJK1_BRACR|nr:hypothetical protein F2Q68_00005151 [Brassica cretica]
MRLRWFLVLIQIDLAKVDEGCLIFGVVMGLSESPSDFLRSRGVTRWGHRWKVLICLDLIRIPVLGYEGGGLGKEAGCVEPKSIIFGFVMIRQIGVHCDAWVGVPNGANPTSYKAAVTHGNMTQEDRRDGHQGRPQENRGGDKGKGIARDRQMSYKQEGPYHPYRERFSKNYEEGSSVNSRKSGYGDWRNGVQSRGYQQPRSEDVEHHSIDHPKLMADAFKGVSRSPGREVPRVPTMDATESSKTRKALLFDEPVVENQVEAPAQVVNASDEEQSGEKQAKSVEETKVEEEALHS